MNPFIKAAKCRLFVRAFALTGTTAHAKRVNENDRAAVLPKTNRAEIKLEIRGAILSILIVLAVIIVPPTFGAGEEDYSSAWCKEQNGIVTTLRDGTKPDCLLENEAVEFDWGKGMKPYECTGQALHYAAVTGKRPLCILIQGRGIDDKEFAKAVKKVSVPVKCMDKNGVLFNCPKSP